MAGMAIERALGWRKLPLASPLQACGSRETFHRARVVDARAEILAFQDSSAQKALAQADLLVRQRANSPAIERGGEVDVLDF
jgi:molybdopterin molybdotransferase